MRDKPLSFLMLQLLTLNFTKSRLSRPLNNIENTNNHF